MNMTNVIHKDLYQSGRWFKLSLIEQMANIGCDIERTIQWKRSNDLAESRRAFDRALELLDFTIVDTKNSGCRLREICRVREALVDHFVYDNEYATTDEYWQQFFYDFNYAAAIQRGR
jgi:hypothetical protein